MTVHTETARVTPPARAVLGKVMRGLRKPEKDFWSTHYMRHNQRRQEHLASLNLPFADRTVLETGAGLGDHTSFFLDRGCTVTVTEPRLENVRRLQKRFPGCKVDLLDLDQPPADGPRVDVVYCYGTLYHLQHPAKALKFLSQCCNDLLLLESCVSGGGGEHVYPVEENKYQASQAISGTGCRPTREWIVARLKEGFPFVYLPSTQPWHKEFPIEWDDLGFDPSHLTRAVFVASRKPLDNPQLLDSIPMRQKRH